MNYNVAKLLDELNNNFIKMTNLRVILVIWHFEFHISLTNSSRNVCKIKKNVDRGVGCFSCIKII